MHPHDREAAPPTYWRIPASLTNVSAARQFAAIADTLRQLGDVGEQVGHRPVPSPDRVGASEIVDGYRGCGSRWEIRLTSAADWHPPRPPMIPADLGCSQPAAARIGDRG